MKTISDKGNTKKKSVPDSVAQRVWYYQTSKKTQNKPIHKLNM